MKNKKRKNELVNMVKAKEKSSVEKFFDILGNEEKPLLLSYLQKRTYESLSERFDDLLKKPHEDKKTNNQGF